MEQKKKEGEVIDDKLIRCIEGTASKAEYDQVWQWTVQSFENRQHYRKLFSTLIASNLLNPVDPEIQNRIWTKLRNQIQASRNAKFFLMLHLLNMCRL